MDRRAVGAAGPRRRLRRRRPGHGDRRVRRPGRARRPGEHRRPGEDHQARREGADRGVQRPRRLRARAQGDDQPGPHRERRAAADRLVADDHPGPPGRLPDPARPAGHGLRRPADRRPIAQRRRADHHARQAFRHRGRRAADRVPPGRRADRPLSVAGHQGPGRHRPGHARPAGWGRSQAGRAGAAGGRSPRCGHDLDQHRTGLSAFARLRRGDRSGPGGGGPVQRGHQHPVDGRPRAGHRGLPTRPGRLQRDAAQDEHPVLRTGQRSGRDHPRLRVHGR